MTIAAGFLCSDGILLASDTLYSSEVRRYGPKFWTITADESLVVLGGAGTETGLKRTKDEAEKRLRPGLSLREIVEVLEGAIGYVDDLLKKEEQRPELLIGIRVNGKTRLYENQGAGRGLTCVDDVSQCVGAGYSLGLYFARSLFRPNMSIRWAKVIAAHLIRNVKTYNDGYCGGDTHLFELPDVGNPRFVKDQSEITDLEMYLGPLERAVSAVLPDETTNDETLRARLNLVTSAIDKALRSNVIDIPVGSTLISGLPSASAVHAPPLTLRVPPSSEP